MSKPHLRATPQPMPARLRTVLRPTAWAARALLGSMLATGLVAPAPGWAQATAPLQRNLPNPCSTANACGPAQAPVTQFVGSGTVAAPQVVGNRMTVTQSSDTSLLNWRSFDVAKGNTVTFAREGSAGNANPAFVSINRIHDTQASRIDGNLSATNGQIYLLNSNGILFGSGANVDVGGLIASTLDIDPRRVQGGLLGDTAARAAFTIDRNNLDAVNAAVRIEGGAVIRAGSVMVFAPTVENAGSIQVTPGGQVVLAAGQRVFLTGSDSATLRGLLVEVGQGGTVTNSGEISTPRGNTTLVGMAVRQDGRITATSALRENGSIRLVAREVASDASAPAQLLAARSADDPFTATFANISASGAVSVGSGSTTQVLLDASDTATAALTDANVAQARSTIDIDAQRVSIGGDTSRQTLLQAHGGDIHVSARSDAAAIVGRQGRVLGSEHADATLVVGADARLDVSGERDVVVDGNRNFIYIDRLTSNDLRDAPAQREGFLLGQGVYVNLAQDHPFIDLSSRRAAVAGTQAERNATAGVIALHAEGAIDVAAGAQFDLRGGSTLTTQGSGRTSQLLTPDGRIVDIMRADARQRYVGFADRITNSVDAPREGLGFTRSYDAPHLSSVAAFGEGRDAGTLELITPRGHFAGQVDGAATPTTAQRGSNAPQGAALRIGSVTGVAIDTLDRQASLSRANVLLTADLASAQTRVPATQQDRLLAIDTEMLRAGGVTRLDVISDGAITLTRDAPIDVGARGLVSLQGNAVNVASSLSAPGGAINIGERPAAAQNLGDRDALNLVPEAERGQMRFGAGVALDVAGRFNNDAVLPAGAVPTVAQVRNGGSITIQGREVDVSDVARFNVNAGASVSSAGVVSGGSAGSLTLRASNATGAGVSDADAGRLDLGERFAQRIDGFGFGAGGRLTLGAPRLRFGGAAAAGELSIDGDLFTRGFESFTFTAADALRVAGGSVIEPQVQLFVATPGLRQAADGVALDRVLRPQAPLPTAVRATQLAFAATRPLGAVVFETGSAVRTGSQGSVRVTAGQSIQIDGTLAAPSGTVSAQLGELSQANFTALTLAQAEHRAIQVGDRARIDVGGTSRVVVDAQGRRSGNVFDGGTVTLQATQGTLAVAGGAQVRADGTHELLDIANGGSTERRDIGSRGGAVSMSAMQGLYLDGTFSARAGAHGLEGGRLSVRFDGLNASQRSELTRPADEVYNSVFRADRLLSIGNDAIGLPALGEAFNAGRYAGGSHLPTALLNAAGFDTVWMASTNTIEAARSASIEVKGSLTLDAQALRVAPDAQLSLRAPVVALGFGQNSSVYAPNEQAAASGGSGRLDVQARSIDLVGHSSLQGIGATTLAAADDIRLRSIDAQGNRYAGQLTSAGDLELRAAQLVPATQTDFSIELVDKPDARLSLAPSAIAPLEPLSAAGQVRLKAPQIDITGRISAPHGAIAIEAADTLHVGAQASLSIAGRQQVLYGTVFNGSQWVLADDPNQTGSNVASAAGLDVLDKQITLKAARADIEPGARLDVSAGGELLAHEFVAGPGGSIDLRLNFITPPVATAGGTSAVQRNPVFALIPSRGDAAAPYDPQLYGDLSFDAARGGSGVFRIGQTLTIGAGSAIPPGTYTVLPARYALLPGAFAVEPVSGLVDFSPARGLTEAGGTTVVAGRLGIDGAGASNGRWSAYRVYTQAQFQRRAEWREALASRFFDSAARAAGRLEVRTPQDAGTLAVAAQQVRFGATIDARPALDAAGQPVGRGAQLSFSAPQIAVTDQPAVVGAVPDAQWLLNADALSALGAESLVLGATATRDANGQVQLANLADRVSVGGTQALRAGEVLLAARGDVSVGAGATISTRGRSAGTTPRIEVPGDGAALLVSQAESLPAFVRRDASAPGSATQGDLRIDAAARLEGRDILFDASREQRYAPSAGFDAQNLGLSAAAINLGAVPAGSAGLNLDAGLLAQLSQVESLSLTSASQFNLYGDVKAGAVDAQGRATLRQLVLDGAGLVNHGNGVDTQVTAGDIVLRNSAAAVTSGDATGSGRLTLRATGGTGSQGTITLGAGDLALQGFDASGFIATGQAAAGGATAAGTGEIRLTGSGRLVSGGALALDAARIAAGSGAVHRIEAAGVLRTVASAAPSLPVADAPQALGASVLLQGRAVEHGGRIELPSGSVVLQASGGAADDDVRLLAGSVVQVAGSTQRFGTQTADASAGRIELRAAAGSVRQDAGSLLDLRGAGSQGDAGRLVISAGAGSAVLQGRTEAAAAATARGAELQLDAGRLAELGDVARATDAAGAAPWQSIDLRVRAGDSRLAAGDTLRAHEVRVSLDGGDAATRPADGRLQVDGAIDASGMRAGRIELQARDAVSLGSGARLAAVSSGNAQEGGSVLLAARIRDGLAADTPLDAIRIVAGARIDVSAAPGPDAGALGGSVTLRAPRIGSDVAVAALPADAVVGARAQVIEATLAKRYDRDLTLGTATPAAPNNPLPTLRDELRAGMDDASVAAMRDRMLAAGDTAWHLRPGLDIATSGKLTVNGAIDFSQQSGGAFTWRYGGSTLATSEPGALTLRAGGDLVLSGGLQDGYSLNGALNTTSGRLTPFAHGDSWRYQLTAGADLGAASAAAVRADATAGDLIVQPAGAAATPVQLRTGTGRIDLAAARDIVLKGPNVSVFSGGTASVSGPNFDNARVAALNPSFTEHGGSVRVAAGRDIVANPATQLVNNWLWRVGRSDNGDFSGPANAPTAWWVNAATFTQGVGALGGGDLVVEAGRDIRSLSTAVPSNAFLDTASGALIEHNRGTLEVRAGATLSGGVHYAQSGAIDLRAERVAARASDDPLIVAQGDNRARVQARADAALYGAFNPTWTTTLPLFTPLGANGVVPFNTAFMTYADDSALSVRSLTGTVALGGGDPLTNARATSSSSNPTLVATSSARRVALTALPPSLDLVSFGGDVQLLGSKWLAPSPQGQLRLLADGSVSGPSIQLAMMDLGVDRAATVATESMVPTLRAPITLTALDQRSVSAGALSPTYDLNAAVRHADTPQPLHADDAQPVAIVARQGDLRGLQLDVPKLVDINVAGLIGAGARIGVQNLSDASLSRIHAGAAIDFSATGGDADLASMQVSGPGVAEILAGGAISLGTGGGIISRGNLNNPKLPAGGATLLLASGLGLGDDGQVLQPDYARVLRQFVAHDAFAAAGAPSASLNAQALEALAARGVDVSALRAALAGRGQAGRGDSAFERWLASLDAAPLRRVAVGLAEQVQSLANARFVATANTDTFAPGYAVLQDLFVGLADASSGLRRFVTSNPLAAASNGAALHDRVVASLDAPTAALLRLGLADPSAVGRAGSAFEQALADLTPQQRADAGRALLAATQNVAGAELDTLRAAGRVGATVGTPFARGLDEFARAFAPAGVAGAADISLVFSQIKAEQSGDLALFAPRGGVLVGLANPPAGAVAKQPYQLGILTLGGGDVTGMVRDNFDVFRSRVFTTAGGDIHLWSSLGNIDAGRGPRDVAVAPPPRLVIDSNGVVSLDVTASVSGSGIGALRTRDDQPPSAIRLIAPNGFIDAGEAGIRADSGTVTLGTNIVLNAGNISAGSGVSGGAVVVAPPAPVPTSSSTAASADRAIEQSQKALAEQQKEAEERVKKERRKRVTGEFIGFGNE